MRGERNALPPGRLSSRGQTWPGAQARYLDTPGFFHFISKTRGKISNRLGTLARRNASRRLCNPHCGWSVRVGGANDSGTAWLPATQTAHRRRAEQARVGLRKHDELLRVPPVRPLEKESGEDQVIIMRNNIPCTAHQCVEFLQIAVCGTRSPAAP